MASRLVWIKLPSTLWAFNEFFFSIVGYMLSLMALFVWARELNFEYLLWQWFNSITELQHKFGVEFHLQKSSRLWHHKIRTHFSCCQLRLLWYSNFSFGKFAVKAKFGEDLFELCLYGFTYKQTFRPNKLIGLYKLWGSIFDRWWGVHEPYLIEKHIQIT